MDVIMLMAATADGKIARDATELVDWTGKADKQYFVEVTRRAGVMIMGSKTFDTIGKALPGRKNIVMTRDKTRKSNSENLIFTDQAPADILAGLEAEGYKEVALIGGAGINSLFARENLITHIHLTLVPTLFGTGLSLFNNEMARELELLEYREISPGHLLLIYRVVR
jgi:dihydrofolate reductase